MKEVNKKVFKMGKGQELYERAKNIIPGGTMLLSKRPEMFLPNSWPSYFSKTKGCTIWDLDNKKYLDFSLMGVGTNTLGYSNADVDKAVISSINKGNLSTLNCAEEVQLAEKLIDINPWAEMVRFARTGGEANAISLRIARAACGKDNVAICGYHGWHDWYLSVNHNEDSDLSSHLLPGLEIAGVPRSLKNSVYPFEYNDFDKLEELVSQNNIGVIKMEVVRNINPTNNFLKRVRDLATKKEIVLIFDECTSGFRETFGGIHKKFKVEPDMAIYGKTLGNGYAITAIVGKKSIMEAAQKSFISSTFWTERIGPTAALKSLEIMEEIKSWEIISEIGSNMVDNWKKISKIHNVEIEIGGLLPLSNFTFKHKNHQKFKTYLTQEFLKKGFLASNIFYSSISHDKNKIERYCEILDEVFFEIKNCISGSKEIDRLLETPIAHSGFKRLN